ncbi:hypothetical protein LTS10_005007 [Elasticomyces elasticus]|nr:hypothetical protein LTS10_005007 [Elasticomyces elasticus]
MANNRENNIFIASKRLYPDIDLSQDHISAVVKIIKACTPGVVAHCKRTFGPSRIQVLFAMTKLLEDYWKQSGLSLVTVLRGVFTSNPSLGATTDEWVRNMVFAITERVWD